MDKSGADFPSINTDGIKQVEHSSTLGNTHTTTHTKPLFTTYFKMVRFLDEQDERDDHRGRRPSSPTRSHYSSGHRDRDYSPDFISGPGNRVPRPYATGAIPSTATATVHDYQPPPPPVPSPPLSPPVSTARNGPPHYVYDDDRDRRGRDRSWERGSGTARPISVSRSRSRSRGPPSVSTTTAPGTRERRIVRETKIIGGPELRDPERAAQALAVSDSARDRRGARSSSRDSRISRDTSRSRSQARSIYTTDDDSDYPHRRRSPSRSRSRRSPSRSRSTRSRNRRSPSPAPPLRKAKDLFSPSTAALGVGVLGAIVGGLAAREATEHAVSHRHHKSNKSYDGHSGHHSSRSRKEEERERKAALISTIVGAAVGGLGANAIERKLEEKKKMQEEERRVRERGGYRELRDRDLSRDEDDGYRRSRSGDGRSRSRHGGGGYVGSSLDTPGYSAGYSDDDGYYGSGSTYGSGTRRGGMTTTVRGR